MKLFIRSVWVGSMILAMGAAAQAQGMPGKPTYGGPAPAGVLRQIHSLNITDQQKELAANIMKEHRGEILSLLTQAIEAHRVVFDRVHADEFNEQAVRDAHRQAAAIGEELAVARARMISELRCLLTPEQKDGLARLKEQVTQRIASRLSDVMTLINDWIETHSTL